MKPTQTGYYWLQQYTIFTGEQRYSAEIVQVVFNYPYRKSTVTMVIAPHWKCQLCQIDNLAQWSPIIQPPQFPKQINVSTI